MMILKKLYFLDARFTAVVDRVFKAFNQEEVPFGIFETDEIKDMFHHWIIDNASPHVLDTEDKKNPQDK